MLVLDASALLAYLNAETGSENVAGRLRGARMSSVNHAEVLGKLVMGGMGVEQADKALAEFGYQIEPFTRPQSMRVAELLPATRTLGLSLGDRACLALAMEYGLPVLTADRAWGDLQIGLDIQLIR